MKKIIFFLFCVCTSTIIFSMDTPNSDEENSIQILNTLKTHQEDNQALKSKKQSKKRKCPLKTTRSKRTEKNTFRLDTKSQTQISPVIYLYNKYADHIYKPVDGFFQCPYPNCTHLGTFTEKANKKENSSNVLNCKRFMKKHLIMDHLKKYFENHVMVNTSLLKNDDNQQCPIQLCKFSSKYQLLIHTVNHFILTKNKRYKPTTSRNKEQE